MTPKEWLKENPGKDMNDFYKWLSENPQNNIQRTSTTIHNQPIQIIINQPSAARKEDYRMLMLAGTVSLIAYFLPWFSVGFLGFDISTISLYDVFNLIELMSDRSDGSVYILFYILPICSLLIFTGSSIRSLWLISIGEVFYVTFVILYFFLAQTIVEDYRGIHLLGTLMYGAYFSFGCALFFAFDMISVFVRR